VPDDIPRGFTSTGSVPYMKRAAALLLLLTACGKTPMTHEDIVDASRWCADAGMIAEARSNGVEWTVTCRAKGAPQ
jgi:hypothetical protein